MSATQRLMDWIAEEAGEPVEAPVRAAAGEIVRRHGPASAAVLFYGSCLRQSREGLPLDGLLDFYLLVDDYRTAYCRPLPALANALLPPNVFYLEMPVDGRVLRAKYAVITLAQFCRGVSRRSVQSALWARFAQPARLVHARDEATRTAVIRALARAVTTMVDRTVPLLEPSFSAAELWTRGFEETYRAELRPEGPSRARQIYERDADRYDRLARWAMTANGIGWAETGDGRGFVLSPDMPAGRRRRLRRLSRARRAIGKLLNLLRLAKGVFTFEGGLEYILWKIERHSGIRTVATPWQRRHPLLSSPVLAWRLYRKGAFR